LCILYLTGAFLGVSFGFEKLCEEMIDIHANTESGALLTTEDTQAIVRTILFTAKFLQTQKSKSLNPF